MSAIIKLEKKHFPVLLNELVNIISPHYGGTFIDCTFGQGGYSKRILEYKKNQILAIDRDKDCSEQARFLKKKYKKRFNFINSKFSDLENIHLPSSNIKGIIFDLGYSTNQINDLSKGISFNSTGKLNMRMGINKISAHDAIHKLSYESLWKIFKYYGDEKKSKIIAKKILQKRIKKNILTEDLVSITNSIKKKGKSKINNSTKVFQAIRIFVNEEISELVNGLINAYKILPIGGIIAVVTFHSLEDKIVKFFFKEYSEIKNSSRYLPNLKTSEKKFHLINKKPILPSRDEILKNPPSRSAKLRCAKKISNNLDFNFFLEKFKYLTEIENLIREI